MHLGPISRTPRLTRDAAREDGGVDLGDLPECDLSDLYPAMDSPELSGDLERVEAECKGFAGRYEGKLAGLGGDGLAGAIAEYEAIDLTLGRVMSFAGLLYYQNTADPIRAKFMGDTQAKITAITQPLVFFTLELNRIDDDLLATALSESAPLRRYRPWLDRLRVLRPHQLSDELEPMGLEATLNLLSDPDRERRQAGGAALAAVLEANLTLFTRITNTLIKDKEVEDNWRKMPSPEHGRHLANDVG